MLNQIEASLPKKRRVLDGWFVAGATTFNTEADTPGKSRKRLQGLDSLRGAAILSVIAYHLSLFGIKPVEGIGGKIYSSVFGIGWIGVDLFFVLSGFLITGILYDSRHTCNYYISFYGRRACRIFPLYYGILIVWHFVSIAIAASHAGPVARKMSDGNELFAWTYTLNWRMAFGGFDKVPVFLHHFWSLSIEEQFYLIWPVIIRKLSKRKTAYVCVSFGVISVLLRLAFLSVGNVAAAHVLTPCRLDALCLGALVAMLLRTPAAWSAATRIAPFAFACACSALVITLMAEGGSTLALVFRVKVLGNVAAAVLCACLVFWSVSTNTPGVTWLKHSKTLQFFGKYSYGLYCFQQPLIVLAKSLGVFAKIEARFGRNWGSIALADLLLLTATVMVALASWHIMEKRLLRMKDLPLFVARSSGTLSTT